MQPVPSRPPSATATRPRGTARDRMHVNLRDALCKKLAVIHPYCPNPHPSERACVCLRKKNWVGFTNSNFWMQNFRVAAGGPFRRAGGAHSNVPAWRFPPASRRRKCVLPRCAAPTGLGCPPEPGRTRARRPARALGGSPPVGTRRGGAANRVLWTGGACPMRVEIRLFRCC